MHWADNDRCRLCTGSAITVISVTAFVGEDLVLRCNTDAPAETLNWLFFRHGSQDFYRFCYEGEIIYRTDKYILESVTDWYNVTVRNISAEDAGKYICEWSIRDKIEFVVTVNNASTTLTTEVKAALSTTKEPSIINGSLYLYTYFRLTQVCYFYAYEIQVGSFTV